MKIEGWAKPKGAKRFHAFKLEEGRLVSLCRAYAQYDLAGVRLVPDQENQQGNLLDGKFKRLRLDSDCRGCSKRLVETTKERVGPTVKERYGHSA